MKNIYVVTALFLVYLFFIAPMSIFVPLLVWVAAFVIAIYLDITRDIAIEVMISHFKSGKSSVKRKVN
jgi:hypothetical protein